MLIVLGIDGTQRGQSMKRRPQEQAQKYKALARFPLHPACRPLSHFQKGKLFITILTKTKSFLTFSKLARKGIEAM